jgi:hypothetical protein
MIKRCTKCGEAYTPQSWAKLPSVGKMDDGAGGVLELRNCPCRSTLALPLLRETSTIRLVEMLEAHEVEGLLRILVEDEIEGRDYVVA